MNDSTSSFKREPSSFELEDLEDVRQSQYTPSLLRNDSTDLFLGMTDYSLGDMMRGMSIEGGDSEDMQDIPKGRFTPTVSVERANSATGSDISMTDAENWLAVGGKSISEGESLSSFDDGNVNLKKEVLASMEQHRLHQQPTPPINPAAFTQFAAPPSVDDKMSSDTMLTTTKSKPSATTLANALQLFDGDDSDDEDEPHTSLLGHEILRSHLDDLNYESNFFGCYWRNRNNNVCGFPCVGSVSDKTTDYQTWQQNQKVRQKMIVT